MGGTAMRNRWQWRKQIMRGGKGQRRGGRKRRTFHPPGGSAWCGGGQTHPGRFLVL